MSLPNPSNLDRTRTLLFILTFVVAFCSIVYELIYSELLTVIFGGTVVRYSITIGLFLFSFGVGSFAYRRFRGDDTNFFRVEVVLSILGPLGLVYIILLNSSFIPLPDSTLLVLSHFPIIAVGFLAGLEVPFLTSLVKDMRDDATGNEFSEVLGMDYIGSLFGTVIYALLLYPGLGLIPSVFVLGLLNSLAAVSFAFRFMEPRRIGILFLVSVLVTGMYAGVVVYNEQVEDTLTGVYIESQIEGEYTEGNVEVSINYTATTPYQKIVLYTREFRNRASSHPYYREKCLRLDTQIQLCESWVDSYHHGLVDVPASMYSNFSNKNVLLLGGGDWIAANYLADYNVSVDQVDIDTEFMEYARRSDFLAQYHDGAYDYDRLNTTVADAYDYLASTEKEYDLILLDLPGVRNDDMLKFYSKEFYMLLRDRLTRDGMVVTWAYSRYSFSPHYEGYMNTVKAAGFDRFLRYYAYGNTDEDTSDEVTEAFYVFSNGEERLPRRTGGYIGGNWDRYANLSWRTVPTYEGAEVNSIFDPNYDMVVEYA
ncbi:MAG: spermidine synthase [Halobacteria archaeon]|nr:spermidine synthase [Halobacteria archaeon]